MKKILTGLLAIGLVAMSTTAMAVIDLNNAVISDPPNYATEIAIPAAGTVLIVNSAVLAEVGFGSNDTDVRYYRYNLNNSAEFATPPVLTIPDDTAGLGGGCTLSQTGTDDEFVIFTCSNMAYLQDDPASLAVGDLTVNGQSSVTISFAQYDSISDAQNQTNAIGSASGTVLGFTSGVNFAACDSATVKLIDVTSGSLLFDEAVTSVSGAGCINLNPAADVWWIDGAQVTMADMVAADSTIEATAPAFTAAALVASNFGAYAEVTPSVYELVVDTNSLTDDQITLTVTGDDLITKGPVTAKYIPVAAVGSDITTLGPITLATFEKNGTTDRISFTLTPNGAYPYFVRITNPSSIAGAVFLTVFNDAGDAVSFNVNTVAGVDGLVADELPAGASTSLMTIESIFAAAQAADATFDVANISQKLRIDVEAEFGTEGNEVIANAFSVSTDGTTFNMVQ